MSTRIRRSVSAQQANGIHASDAPGGQQSTASPQGFRPLPDHCREAGEMIGRALRLAKAETLGECYGCSRSQVYALAGGPEEIPLGMLERIAENDPDPSSLDRLAHALLVMAAGIAAKRKQAGEVSVRFTVQQPRLF